jgi:hypothetical protein
MVAPGAGDLRDDTGTATTRETMKCTAAKAVRAVTTAIVEVSTVVAAVSMAVAAVSMVAVVEVSTAVAVVINPARVANTRVGVRVMADPAVADGSQNVTTLKIATSGMADIEVVMVRAITSRAVIIAGTASTTTRPASVPAGSTMSVDVPIMDVAGTTVWGTEARAPGVVMIMSATDRVAKNVAGGIALRMQWRPGLVMKKRNTDAAWTSSASIVADVGQRDIADRTKGSRKTSTTV